MVHFAIPDNLDELHVGDGEAEDLMAVLRRDGHNVVSASNCVFRRRAHNDLYASVTSQDKTAWVLSVGDINVGKHEATATGDSWSCPSCCESYKFVVIIKNGIHSILSRELTMIC